jgi:glycosyltransferase involved in cell wall biosynthesis
MTSTSLDSTKPTVNFVVEDMFYFKYIGCVTAAKTLYHEINKGGSWNATWNNKLSSPISHFHTFGPVALSSLRKSTGINILTAHSTPRVNVGNVAGTKLINQIYPHVYKRFDHIITISQACENEIKTLLPDVPVTRIPNGIDLSKFKRNQDARAAFREMYGISDDETLVLSVGQLSPRKGVYDFLEVAKECPDKKFVWVGGSPYGALSAGYISMKYARNKASKNVIFTDFIPDVTYAYSGADIFFMPSYAETFGLVLLEALACELPVVARDLSEFKEIYGSSISLFSNNNEARLALEDAKKLSSLQSFARESAKTYDISDVAEKTTRLYTELLDNLRK